MIKTKESTMKKAEQKRLKDVKKKKSKMFDGLCKDVYANFTDPLYFKNGRRQVKFVREPIGSSSIYHIDFACNGRYLAFIEFKCNPHIQETNAWNNSLPISQLVLTKLVDPFAASSPTRRNDTTPSDEVSDFEIVASINLDFIDIYCVALSNDTTQIAIYGFSYKDIPRRPVISVYEFIQSDESVAIGIKSKLTFESCEILSARVTSSKFLPRSDNILLTSICTDYHSFRKTNCLDFWDTESGMHIAKLSLIKECPKLKGYVSSTSFSSDGLILAMTSSANDWQLLLFNLAVNKFGRLFSLKEQSFDDPVDHFANFCEFITNFDKYELVVFSQSGVLTRLTINPDSLMVKHIDYSIQIQNIPAPCITAFKYSPASARLYFITNNTISYVDLENGKRMIDNELDINEANIRPCIAVSKTGRDVAAVTNYFSAEVGTHKYLDISLKNLCRICILKLIPENRIPEQDLPRILTEYLLYGKY